MGPSLGPSVAEQMRAATDAMSQPLEFTAPPSTYTENWTVMPLGEIGDSQLSMPSFTLTLDASPWTTVQYSAADAYPSRSAGVSPSELDCSYQPSPTVVTSPYPSGYLPSEPTWSLVEPEACDRQLWPMP
jgi:hypothetical protein